MRIIATDNCSLVDLAIVDAETAILGLPFEFVIPDLLFIQEVKSQAVLTEAGWVVVSSPGDRISRAQALRQEAGGGVSFNDVLALVVAEEEGGILFSGDGALRSLATRRGVEVHGMIWAIEQMLAHSIWSRERAIDALVTLREDPRVWIGDGLLSAAIKRMRP